MREVGLDDALGGLVHVGELKELRLLLVEQVREVLDAVLELGVELRPVVALEIVLDLFVFGHRDFNASHRPGLRVDLVGNRHFKIFHEEIFLKLHCHHIVFCRPLSAHFRPS